MRWIEKCKTKKKIRLCILVHACATMFIAPLLSPLWVTALVSSLGVFALLTSRLRSPTPISHSGFLASSSYLRLPGFMSGLRSSCTYVMSSIFCSYVLSWISCSYVLSCIRFFFLSYTCFVILYCAYFMSLY